MTRKRFLRLVLILVLNLLILISLSGFQIGAQSRPVTITNEGDYYNVVLDYSSGLTRWQMGAEYARQIMRAQPEYEKYLDSYLWEATYFGEAYYQMMLARVNDIKPQVNPEYWAEVEGMAEQFSGGTNNVRGDGKISRDEFYLFSLIPDLLRDTQCGSLAVWDWTSANWQTIVGRNLDWPGGTQNQVSYFQAIVTYKQKCKTIYSIGYLGFPGIITGFNQNGVFAAIHDCPSEAPYTSKDMNSYPMDLRYALETKDSLIGVGNYMKDPSRKYTYNHVIFLADRKNGQVLENNISGCPTSHRDLRTSTSLLNPGVSWWYRNAVAAVNSFVLAGNFDDHTQNAKNANRWSSFQTQLLKKGPVITIDELREIMSFDNGDGPGAQSDGDIYNETTQQSVIFVPETLQLEVFFHPRGNTLPSDPVYQVIRVIR